MKKVTTITPKFQVHIPVSIRQKLGLIRHGRAMISVEKSKIIIEPIKSRFTTLAGKYQVKKPIPAETIREKIDYS